jgi:hypothetical protein
VVSAGNEPNGESGESKQWPNGAGDGVRTRDINLGKVALYQLSYSRVEWLFDILR